MGFWQTTAALAGAGVGIALVRRALRNDRSEAAVPGEPRSGRTRALAWGSKILQRRSPLDGFDVYVAGFHPLYSSPDQQMEAHHFCRVVNEDFIQCVVFDGAGPDARLTGVEFIVSERIFEELPDEEQNYWHPHNFEVLSGQLVAPGLPAAAEDRLMRRLLNSYGKTWHFWQTGKGDPLPYGDACLAWSFNREGQLREELEHRRNAEMGIDPEARKARRARLAAEAHPQRGVDLLDPFFGPAPRPFGVADAREDWQR